jgi:hypothetical protein
VFSIIPGTDVFFTGNTLISSDNLTLIPTSGLTLNGTILSRNTTLQHGSANPSISRVYRFSTAVANFSGSIQINYVDAELNGIMEPSLRLNIHNGTGWQSFANNTNDGTANTVLTGLISSITLNELALADVALTLPVQWKSASAYRIGQAVKISWKTENENNVSHFNVQRSVDTRDWINISGDVAATNKLSQSYEKTDPDYQTRQIFYRIKQSGLNGKISYSEIMPVVGEINKNTVTLFPNPVTSKFYLTGNASLVTKIELYNASGSLIKRWKEFHNSYDIHEFPSGNYSIRISKKDELPQTIQISKQ